MPKEYNPPELARDLAYVFARMYGFNAVADKLKPRSNVDERIAKLERIKDDLVAATEAVTTLQEEAEASKAETQKLQAMIADLESDRQTALKDKDAAEQLLALPEDSVARLILKANARDKGRALFQGIAIGLTTGVVSSGLVWYFTNGSLPLTVAYQIDEILPPKSREHHKVPIKRLLCRGCAYAGRSCSALSRRVGPSRVLAHRIRVSNQIPEVVLHLSEYADFRSLHTIVRTSPWTFLRSKTICSVLRTFRSG